MNATNHKQQYCTFKFEVSHTVKSQKQMFGFATIRQSVGLFGLTNEGSFAPKQHDQWSIDLNALRDSGYGNHENAIAIFTPCVRM